MSTVTVPPNYVVLGNTLDDFFVGKVTKSDLNLGELERHGGRNVYLGNTPSLLIEVLFITNPSTFSSLFISKLDDKKYVAAAPRSILMTYNKNFNEPRVLDLTSECSLKLREILSQEQLKEVLNAT